MTLEQFNTQMNRLTEQFGKAAYGKERATLIWREVQRFDVDWFKRTVDDFLGAERQAPLLPQFRDAASKERERLWEIEKKDHERDAIAIHSGLIDSGEHRVICQYIVKRMNKAVSDADWDAFMRNLKNLGMA